MKSVLLSTSDEVTRMLKAWKGGDASALDRLTPIVYAELHRLAGMNMVNERQGHLLQPSALVNEAFIRLIGNSQVAWESRTQFFSVAARLMRQILIDFARAQGARKRGQHAAHVDIEQARGLAARDAGLDPEELLDLDEAIQSLAALDARQAQVVELRFFGGLENAEIAEALGVSEPTVIRDWRLARAWLFDALNHES